MSLGTAMFMTVLASTASRGGIVLLKRAVVRVRERRHLARALLHSRPALLGLVLQGLGIALYLLAVRSPHAPISILQPLRAFGIVIMAFLAVAFLHERLRVIEWTGVALSMVGLALLAYSHAATRISGSIHPTALLALVGAGGILGAVSAGLLSLRPWRHSHELLYGVLVGICLGIGYLHIKVFFLACRQGSAVFVVLGAVLMTAGLLGGLAVLLKSFRTGRALVVTTVNLLVNQAIVILGGIFCLGEEFPQEPLAFRACLLGLVATLVGIAMLGRFKATRAP